MGSHGGLCRGLLQGNSLAKMAPPQISKGAAGAKSEKSREKLQLRSAQLRRGKSSKIAKIPNFAREALEPSEARLRGRSGTLLPLNAKAEGLCVPSGRRPGAEGPLAKLGKSEIP